jgi:phospholipase D1/2
MSAPLKATPGAWTRARVVTVGLIGIALIALAVAWSATPLAKVFDPDVIGRYRVEAQELPFAPLIVVVAFIVLGLFAAPGSLMIGATTLLFGPTRGALYAFVAMLANGLTVYAIARYAARDFVDAWLARHAASKLGAFTRRLERRGFFAVMLMRLTPAPYTVQNVIIGAARIRIVDFVLGTAIGILPILALMAGITTRFDAWLVDPQWTQLELLVGAVVAAIAIVWWLKRWATSRGGDGDR